MSDNIHSLFQFLREFGPEVSVRSAPIDDGLKERVCKFAAGQLDHDERNAVATELLGNPDWIAFLAEQIQKQSAPNTTSGRE